MKQPDRGFKSVAGVILVLAVLGAGLTAQTQESRVNYSVSSSLASTDLDSGAPQTTAISIAKSSSGSLALKYDEVPIESLPGGSLLSSGGPEIINSPSSLNKAPYPGFTLAPKESLRFEKIRVDVSATAPNHDPAHYMNAELPKVNAGVTTPQENVLLADTAYANGAAFDSTSFTAGSGDAIRFRFLGYAACVLVSGFGLAAFGAYLRRRKVA